MLCALPSQPHCHVSSGSSNLLASSLQVASAGFAKRKQSAGVPWNSNACWTRFQIFRRILNLSICFTQYFTLMSSSLRSRERGPRIPSGTDVFWSWGVLLAQVGSFFALFSHFWRLLSILWGIFVYSGVRKRFFLIFDGFLIDFGRIWEPFLDDFSPYLRKL